MLTTKSWQKKKKISERPIDDDDGNYAGKASEKQQNALAARFSLQSQAKQRAQES